MSGAGIFGLRQMEVGAAPDIFSRRTHSCERDHLTFICAFTFPCCNLVLLRAEAVEIDGAVALVVALRTIGGGPGSTILSGFIFNAEDVDGP